MASKLTLTDDMIKAQWKKQNDSHDAQWNAVVHIGEAVGLQFDEKGNVTGSVEPTLSVAQLSAQPVIDKDSLNQAVADAIQANMPTKVVAPTAAVMPKQTLLQTNKQIVDLAVEHCEQRVNGLIDKTVEAFSIAADSQAVEPIFEERVLRRILKFHQFVGKILRWFVQDMCSAWLKVAAYNTAICFVMFGGYQYYQNQKLLSEVKRTKVVRYILSGDPANKAMIEKIDTLLEQKGVDKVYNSVIF